MLMEEILLGIMCVQALSDDLHYRSIGNSFYANHLLADRVKDGLDKTVDAIKEVYFLGELKSEPPSTDYLMEQAAKMVSATRKTASEGETDSNNALIASLMLGIDLLAKNIELFKKENVNLMSGTVALLDGLSQSMLLSYGLLNRNLLY